MISFYPGPSKLRASVGDYMQQAYSSDILSFNHRSSEFVEVIAGAIESIKTKLNVPQNYEVYFVNSATECWQIIAQSLVAERSLHIYNGAFGQRWMEFTTLLGIQTSAKEFNIQEPLPVPSAADADVICITNCETSNGSYVSSAHIASLREANPEKLIAVDATSCMAGVNLDFSQADVWFASVQKCFGIPSGLGIMVCSPRAIEKAKALNSRAYYNSMVRLHEKMKFTQTNNTPNMLAIYLLGKVMQHSEPIAFIENALKARAHRWRTFFGSLPNFHLLIREEALASPTVIAVSGEIDEIKNIKSRAKKSGLLLGNGYGAWAETTFRIANFPAHTDGDVDLLLDFFKQQY